MFSGGGKGMGGGGGSMLRAAGRAMTRAAVEPISASSTSAATSSTAASRATHKPNSNNSNNNNNISLVSGSGFPFSGCNVAVSANYGGVGGAWPQFGESFYCGEDYEWVSVEGSEDEGSLALSDDFVLSPVPSHDEVHSAVSALTQVFDTASCSQLVRDKFYDADNDVSYQFSSGSQLDWLEPSSRLCDPMPLKPYGSNRVYDAFHLLQNDPSVQKMVISLSSDKGVWDAVLNNEVVRELRESYQADKNMTICTPEDSECSDETVDESNSALNVVRWIFENTIAKFKEVFEKLTKLVNELFTPAADGKKATAGAMDPFEEKLRTSFLVSVVVLLVVVVTRAKKA